MPSKYSFEDIEKKVKSINANLEVISVDGLGTPKHRKIIIRDNFGMHEMQMSSLARSSNPSIKSSINKLEYLDNKLKYLQPELYGQIKLIEIFGEGKKKHNMAIVSTEFGDCKVATLPLLLGCKPTIMAAINKNEYYEKQARLVHGNKYSYIEINYTNCLKKIKIWCNEHKEYFLQTPYYHLFGAGCKKCGIVSSTEFSKQNPTGWSYENWAIAAKRSVNFDGFKVYIIKCCNDDEVFFKIGKTYTSVRKRFCNNVLMPYQWQSIKEITGDAMSICELENEMKKKHGKYSYTPKLSFKGMGECFSKIIAA